MGKFRPTTLQSHVWNTVCYNKLKILLRVIHIIFIKLYNIAWYSLLHQVFKTPCPDSTWLASQAFRPLKMRELINHFKCVGYILKLIIFCFCFGMSGYHTVKFFLEFLQNPQTTSLTIDFIANQPFPAITICIGSDSYYLQSYNEDILRSCDIGQ